MYLKAIDITLLTYTYSCLKKPFVKKSYFVMKKKKTGNQEIKQMLTVYK